MKGAAARGNSAANSGPGLRLALNLLLFFLLLPGSLAAGGWQERAGTGGQGEEGAQVYRVGVFVPGVVAGSPIYEMMVRGAERAVSEREGTALKVIEGGFNQAEWSEKLTAMAATGEYALILTSNPAMPFVCREVAEKFSQQKFLNVDGYLDGHPQIATVLYNQVEQGYLVGYLGGLVTKSAMSGANSALRVGMVVAQEYPALLKMIKPGFQQGLAAVDPQIHLDYRIVGNWYDANKGADLAHSMMDAGVDVILTIAGGANQGVIKAAQERGKYVLFFDSVGYSIAPGTIVGCAVLEQERLVYEQVMAAFRGELVFGRARVVHARDGYVDFADRDPLYRKGVPEAVRQLMAGVVEALRSGELTFPVPRL